MLHVSELSQVGRTTLGGLLALGYSVVVSFKRTCTSVNRDQLLIAAETTDTLNETFLVLKGPSRKVYIQLCCVMSYASVCAYQQSWLFLESCEFLRSNMMSILGFCHIYYLMVIIESDSWYFLSCAKIVLFRH